MQAYLSFSGNCAQAMAFYASALGGEVSFAITYGESPMAKDVPQAQHGLIMHSTLMAMGLSLMGSDLPPDRPFEGYKGFSLSVQGETAEKGKQLFDALAAGGQVTMPYGATFWAKGFGMLTDKFGVPWMVNCEH